MTANDQKTQQPAQDKPDWAMSRAEAERARRAREGLAQRRRRWPWVLLALVVAAGGGYSYYSAKMAPVGPDEILEHAQKPEAVMQLSTAEIAVLQPQTLQRTVRVIGTLAPIRQAQLSSQVNGRVEAVSAQPGDRVTEGEVLAQIDVETLTLELKQARSNADATQARLNLAEVQLERTQQLIDRGFTTTSSLDEARSTVTQLRAQVSALEDQVAGAELRLRNATVRAPYAGAISKRSAEPGQYVGIGTPLVTVVDLTSVEMNASAAVGAGSQLTRGQAVSVHVDGIPGRTFEGVVTRINPVAEEGTRTIPVYVQIENADGILLGGMFGVGQIVVEDAPQSLAVPATALREDAAGHHLLQIEDGRLVRRQVETDGDWAGGLVRILSGVEPGQTVVTAPLPSLASGDAVEIVEE
ncbi:efflux RND transporter periplasmic adaptor subunit [Phaeovulum sp.]|uniref:efflux RND transporter periplasmic adaptor subunit n=1 Tax=Phaeovulum sp. TaxID=2934796 RepID=UPI0035627106